MKKIITYVVCLLMVFGVAVDVFAASTKTKAKEKTETKKEEKKETISCQKEINISLFWGDGCPHCEAAIEFLNSIEKQYGHCFELSKYEVWKDKENRNLMSDVAKYFGEEVGGVPYIIIGEKTFSGYSERSNDAILKAIQDAANDEEYVDVVAKIKDGELKQSGSAMSDTIITIVIIVVMVGGIGALVATSKSKD